MTEKRSISTFARALHHLRTGPFARRSNHRPRLDSIGHQRLCKSNANSAPRPLAKCRRTRQIKVMTDLSLATRSELPSEFRLILADYPRAGWPDHRDFNGLAAFWLDRHLGFRQLLATLTADTQGRIDGKLAPDAHGQRLQRLGSRFLSDLIGHHQIEDDAYFPELARLEPRIARGFQMLDADHHALHALIDRFAKGANAVLGEPNGARQREAVYRFLTDLTDFDRLLVRHLTDEEDLVLPVVLKHRVG